VILCDCRDCEGAAAENATEVRDPHGLQEQLPEQRVRSQRYHNGVIA